MQARDDPASGVIACDGGRQEACVLPCSTLLGTVRLNRECFCRPIESRAVEAELDALLRASGIERPVADTHAHLLASVPVYVAANHIEAIAKTVAAVERVVSAPVYVEAALRWAPPIARFDPGSRGGLLGLDFHIGPDGPKLIEINTNPGGAMINALSVRALRAGAPILPSPVDAPGDIEAELLQSMLEEWRSTRGTDAPAHVAIVDEAPEAQYLYPEFLLYRELFRRAGIRCSIAAPDALAQARGGLWLGNERVDMVYNRLTDFALEQPAHAALRAVYLKGGVVLSPHPRAHALYADKRNLTLLADAGFLASAGVDPGDVETLLAALPATVRVTADNREALWADRRHLFFKPAGGYGGKAAYRGEKLTRKTWDMITQGNFIAQQYVPPGERRPAAGASLLKIDIRCYAYAGRALLYAARAYHGQTTNFRTPGGGFAPVLTRPRCAPIAAPTIS